MFAFLIALMSTPASAQKNICDTAHDPKNCNEKLIEYREKSGILWQCLRNSATQISTSGMTLNEKYAAFLESCSSERGSCVASYMKYQAARALQASPIYRNWSIAIENARNRCDESYVIIAARSFDTEGRQQY